MLWPHLTFWCLILMSVEPTLWQLHGQASCIKPYVYFTVWGMHLHRRTCLHKHPLITTASDFVQDKKIRKTHFCVKINPIFLTFWNSYRKLNYKNYLNLETWYLDNNLIPVKTLCDKKPVFLFVGIYSSETISLVHTLYMICVDGPEIAGQQSSPVSSDKSESPHCCIGWCGFWNNPVFLQGNQLSIPCPVKIQPDA